MTIGEVLFLALVSIAFLGFATPLAWVSRASRNEQLPHRGPNSEAL
jgi:hypothetical protein